MAHKYLVRNTSDTPVFIAEAGKLLQPGGETTANRLDAMTRKDSRLEIETGSFDPQRPVGKVLAEKQRYDEEDEDEAPVKAPTETGPATLVNVKTQSRTVPLEAASSKPAPARSPLATPAAAAAKEDDNDDAGEDDEDAPLSKDELDDEVAKADKPTDKGEEVGFVTRRSPSEPLTGR